MVYNNDEEEFAAMQDAFAESARIHKCAEQAEIADFQNETYDRIIFFANELIKALRDMNVAFMNPEISGDFGSINVWLHGVGTDNPRIKIENTGKFTIEGKLTAKIV